MKCLRFPLESDKLVYKYTESGRNWITSERTQYKVFENFMSRILDKDSWKLKESEPLNFQKEDYIDSTPEERRKVASEMLRRVKDLIKEKV